MDTKLKSIKYSVLTKIICLVLSIVMFVLSALSAVKLLEPFSVFSYLGEIGNTKTSDFYCLRKVGQEAFYSASCLPELMNLSEEELDKKLEAQHEEIVRNKLNMFLNQKAEIIKAELQYVVNSANSDTYEMYENTGVTDYYVNSIPDTPVEKQKYVVDPAAPNSVKAAQKILNYAKGQEFLKYVDLIRESALTEVIFTCELEMEDYNKDYSSYETLISYESSTQEAKEAIESCFNNLKQSIIVSSTSNLNWAKNAIEKNDNMYYYIQKGDKVISNISSFDEEIKNINEHSNYFYKIGEKSNYTYTGQDSFYMNIFDGYDKVLFYFSESENITGDDGIAVMYKDFQRLNYNINPYLIRTVVFLFGAVTAAIVLLVLSGHKNGKDGITLAFIDKLPGDVHLILTGVITAGILFLISLVFNRDHLLNIPVDRYVVIGSLSLAWALIIELATSITRIAKSDKPYFRSFITVKIVVGIFRFFKKIFGKFKKACNTVFGYKPKHFKENVILGAVLYTLSKAFFLILSMIISLGLFLFIFAVFVVLDILIAIYFANYAKNLDKIIVASTERKSVDFSNEKVNESLAILNNSLKVTNEEFNSAVEKAIKNERTKAELITNVSHDLKTPLTSIISYIGLLKGCKIEDENAQKYIDILNEKSYNLKNLFENLIEASKVSSGNIKLNKVSLNLKELIVQAIVEYAPEFEERKLDLKFNEDAPAINVFADGQRTYRIIENLLSNAKKYSAPNTRVYTSIREENGYGVFEIKNISKEPLDISPEELTERFVRGDASRGEEEGNGLGLSIAKELCTLQNGYLELKIDGDLFKATVYLPKQ